MLVAYERFNAVPLPVNDPSEPLDSWPVRSSLFDVSSGGAYRANGTQRSKKGSKTIRRRGTLLETSLAALQAAYALLEVEVGNSGRLYGRTGSGEVVWTPAELTGVRAVSEPRSTFRYKAYVALDVETELVLPTPAWYAETPGAINGVDLFDQDQTDLATVGSEGDAIDGTSTLFAVNDGDLPSSKVVVTVTSGTGTITSVTIANVTTGHTLAWTGTLTAGQQLVIDAGAMRVTRAGVDAYAGLTEPADKERWMELAPGVNEIAVTWTDSAVDDSSRVALSYEHTYS